MALAFPDSPTDGQIVTLNSVSYTYNSSKSKWERSTGLTSTVNTDISDLTDNNNLLGSVDLSAVNQPIIPDTTLTYDLGSSTKRWKDLYLSSNTIDLNGAQISSDGTRVILPAGSKVGDLEISAALEEAINLDGTTLTKTFTENESVIVNLDNPITTTASVFATKEVTPSDIVTKSSWDVNATASNYDFHNTAYDTTLVKSTATVVSQKWNIATGSYLQNFSVGLQESFPAGVFFKPDGMKMYIVGTNGDEFNEYDLSTAWDISSASHVQSFSIAGQDNSPQGLFFKPDGTKVYVTGQQFDAVYEYDLSTAWDISSASYLQNFSVNGEDSSPSDLFFKPDGTKMYIIGQYGDDVNEYDLSTAWDVSSASYLQNFSVAPQETIPNGLFFKPDGTKMYIVGAEFDAVYEYDLSTAWDISSASYLQNFSVAPRETNPQAVFFKPDGTKMYVSGAQQRQVYEYDLSVSYVNDVLELGTGSFTSNDVGKIVSAGGGTAIILSEYGEFEEITPIPDVTFSAGSWTLESLDVDSTDGVKIPFVNVLFDAFDITTATYVQSFDVQPQGFETVGIFFKTDGTKMYILMKADDTVYEYDLSTAWDVSSASYNSNNFGVGSQESLPLDLFFKPDGTKMYIIGTNGDDVNEYDLSTAWDVSSASYSQNFSVASQDSNPAGIFFKPDGTKMYITGYGDSIHEYDLSIAWDVSSASHVQSFSGSHPLNPTNIFFSEDGTIMIILGGGDNLTTYNLTTPWNISTATNGTTEPTPENISSPFAFHFKSDGTKMYIVGASLSADVMEFDIGSNADFYPSGYVSTITNQSGQINTEFWSDINSMTPDDSIAGTSEIYYAISTDDKTTFNIVNATLGERSIVRNNNGTWEYNSDAVYSSSTWTPASSNDAFTALNEAISENQSNRMDSTTLSNVGDDDHFALGDTLDLAIIMKTDGVNVPSSDGVNINYIGQLLNRSAIIGTDFIYDQLNDTTISITTLTAGNYKFRII